jgi:hypothetical protein
VCCVCVVSVVVVGPDLHKDGLCDRSMEMWLNEREEVVNVRFSNLIVGRHRRVDIGS